MHHTLLLHTIQLCLEQNLCVHRNATHSEHMPLVRASSVFIHNALKEFDGETFTDTEQIHLCSRLLKPVKDGFQSAKDALLLLLLRRKNVLKCAYIDMPMENKLCLLQIICNELPDLLDESENECVFTKDTIEFLIERFCRRSDLILKTSDIDLDDVDAREIVILLDILAILTATSCKTYRSLKGYKSLLINCTCKYIFVALLFSYTEVCIQILLQIY